MPSNYSVANPHAAVLLVTTANRVPSVNIEGGRQTVKRLIAWVSENCRFRQFAMPALQPVPALACCHPVCCVPAGQVAQNIPLDCGWGQWFLNSAHRLFLVLRNACPGRTAGTRTGQSSSLQRPGGARKFGRNRLQLAVRDDTRAPPGPSYSPVTAPRWGQPHRGR